MMPENKVEQSLPNIYTSYAVRVMLWPEFYMGQLAGYDNEMQTLAQSIDLYKKQKEEALYRSWAIDNNARAEERYISDALAEYEDKPWYIYPMYYDNYGVGYYDMEHVAYMVSLALDAMADGDTNWYNTIVDMLQNMYGVIYDTDDVDMECMKSEYSSESDCLNDDTNDGELSICKTRAEQRNIRRINARKKYVRSVKKGQKYPKHKHSSIITLPYDICVAKLMKDSVVAAHNRARPQEIKLAQCKCRSMGAFSDLLQRTR